MGFKLVRVDAPEPAKIPLNAGTQIIGRGSFPDCDDNRMSRKHALVTVTGETVTLKSLHQNPCFYSISDAHQTVMLAQGKTVSLKSGDHFGLLPERNWYELIYYKESAEFTNPSTMVEENRISLSESFLGTFSTQYGNKQVSGVKEKTNSRNNVKSTKSYKYKKDDEDNDSDSSTLSLEGERGEESTQVAESRPSTSYFNARNQVPNDPNTLPNELGQTGPDETSSDVQSPPGKRSHTPDRIPDAKKVKTEPESPKTEGSQDPTEKPQSTEKTDAQVHDPYATIEPQMSMDIEPQDAKIFKTEPNDPSIVNTEPESPNNANTEHSNDADIDYLDQQSHSNADDGNKKPQDPTDKNIVPKKYNTEPPNPIDINTEPQNPIDMNTEPQNPKDMNTESQNPIDIDTDSLGPNDANTESQESTDGDTEAQSPKDVKNVKKDADEAKPGPSQAQPGSSKDGDAPPIPPACPARERCMYGANCYRKNPQHKIQFSHPGEADYGQGDKGQCPYGADCRRRDARHWAHHDHPPGAAPPAPNQDPTNRQGKTAKKRQRKVVKQPSESEDSEQDSPSADLIVHGKRMRKTVKRDSWSDSGEESKDPFATDESDEWEPSKLL